MRRLRLFIFILSGAAMILSFQNCAKTGLSTDGGAAGIGDAGGSLKVTSSVALSGTSQAQALQSVQVNRYVQPLSLDFGAGAAYHLDLASGEVLNQNDHAAVAQLSDAQMGAINDMLAQGVLASKRDFLAPDTMCAEVIVDGYANLHTNSGDVMLGSGTSSCDNIDLFRDDGSGQLMGLKIELANLAEELSN